MMTKLLSRLRCLRQETQAQDMIEYALIAGLVAVSAGVILPPVAPSFSAIFSKVGSILGNIP